MRKLYHRHKKDLYIAFFIFVLAFSLRVGNSQLEAINSDEHFWNFRTNRFHLALLNQDWPNTLVSGHPGTSLNWISLISLRSTRLVYRLADPSYDYQDFPYLLNTFDRVHFAYQLPIMLITSLLIALSYIVLKFLSNRLFALIASSLLLSDLFFLAHSRLVQLDALQTSFLIGSLLTSLLYLRYKRRPLVILTGILLGLNSMTRIYGAGAFPFLLLVMHWDTFKDVVRQKSAGVALLKDLSMNLFLLLSTAVLTSVILLPALLVSPKVVMDSFYRSIFVEGVEGRFDGKSFFAGQSILGGEPRIYYLISLIFRQSVVPFLMLPITLYLLLRRKIKDENIRQILTIVLLFSLYWGIALSFPSKKEDRYILPLHLMIDIFVAGGIYTIWVWIADKKRMVVNAQQKCALVGVLFLIGISMYSVHGVGGQYLGYYNPLLGGSSGAINYIQVGWGEGLRDVATYLNGLDNPEDIIVASWHESSLSPYCICKVTEAFNYEGEDVSHIVFYRDQMQRQQEEVMIEKYFRREDIVFVSSLNGTEYAWVVKKPTKQNNY